MFDCHIHSSNKTATKVEFLKKLSLSGMRGGIVISAAPLSFGEGKAKELKPDLRLSALMNIVHGEKNLFPFYWIDPTENDAIKQIDMAIKAGAMGFKIICNKFYIREKRVLAVVKVIAQKKKPILFHSGILWDGGDSARFNRPAEFEALINVPGLRFALAHISWPWTDECIALFGKFLASGKDVDMYIDTTPGTPPIYREEALKKLFGVGYDVEKKVIFGSDSSTDNYNVKWVKEWIKRDTAILNKYRVSKMDQEYIFGENLRRFVGLRSECINRKQLVPGV
jgi:predicted TIM-barrel fold metal-dependent hydrolase